LKYIKLCYKTKEYWCCCFCRLDLRGFWWCFKGGIAGVPW